MTWRPEVLEHLGRPESAAKARAALWRVGDLGWALHADQHAARERMQRAEAAGERRFVFMCGRRWGKTRFFVVDAFEFCLKNPGSVIPYAALTSDSAAQYVFPEAQLLIDAAPEDAKPELVDGEVRFPNGSIIRIAGCETELSANRLRGKAAPRGYIDEAGFNPSLVYVVESVVAWTLATTDGTLIMGSSPPLTPAHPFWSRYAQAADDAGTLIRRKTTHAPHIKPHVLAKMCEDMGGPSSIEWRREGECEVLTDSRRAVIPEWADHGEACVGNLDTWPTAAYRDWYASADLGFADGSAGLLGWWDFLNERLVIEDERICPRPTSDVVVSAVASMEEEHIPKGQSVVSRVADAALITIADMAKLQSNVDEVQRWKPAKKDDLQAAVNNTRVHVKRHQILIHPRCRVLIRHVGNAIWNKQRTEFERVKKDEEAQEDGMKHFDALAALIYLDRSINRQRNPYPGKPPPSHMAGLNVPAHIAHPPSPGKLPSRWTRR